jgi:PAS domain S-box-containing protein
MGSSKGKAKMGSENKVLNSLVAILPDPAFAVDEDLKVTEFNAAAEKLTGISAKNALGKKCHEVFKSNLCKGDCPIKSAMTRGEALSEVEVELEGPDEKKIDAVACAMPLVGEKGKPVGGIEILRDVTAEREMVRQLEEDKARLDDFHASSMELAMGISECFQVLSEMRQGNLEARVSEYTLSSSDELMANLGQALNDALDEIELQVETIGRQQSAIQELSTPILQLWDNVLALPVIGVVDTRRSAEIMERLLAEITARQSRFVILDITGVEVVDTRTADHFIKVIKAAELLGANCILTGIRPAVAQTLVDLGIDLSSISTLRNLKEGLKECQRRMEDELDETAGN